jgi:hypothetical protein
LEALSYKIPGLSRIKGLIAVFAASIALIAAIQVATPSSASAMRPECNDWALKGDLALLEDHWELAQFYWGVAEICENG